ncbi:MAG: cysteine desulfurase family protein [Nitrospiraceae bacterium]|nr:cysteine desulfurase family protein [Nitrospiraceae bacterium]
MRQPDSSYNPLMIYLDNNASTRPAPAVREAVCRALDEFFGNPSSGHLFGRRARALIEEARGSVASLIGEADASRIYFTSGGTEANNIAIFGAAGTASGTSRAGKDKMPVRGHIISQQTEHPAVLAPLNVLKERGFEITLLPVDRNGVIELKALEGAIRKETVLVSIMHANNETGVIQPIEEAVRICKGKNQKTLFHTDAAQTVGKVPVDVERLGVDMLSVAAHKFYGPKGVGALYIRDGARIKNTIMFGAGHERGIRPGTENTPYIAGLGAACRLAKEELPATAARLERFRQMLFGFLEMEFPGVRINGGGAARLPNTLNVSIPGVEGDRLVHHLADSVAISAGSACHEGSKTPSAVLMALGASDEEAFCSVRISLGRETTEEEITEAAGLLRRAVLQLAQAR